MNTNNDDVSSKYACPHCGSVEVRGEFDSYPVFLADGDTLVYTRSETIVAGLSALYCNTCHNFITDDLHDAAIK